MEKDWVEYPVFRIDFAVGDYTNAHELQSILDSKLAKWENLYGLAGSVDSLGERFRCILEAAEKNTGHKAVVLVDEYDKPMLDALGTEMEEKNRNTLKGFFGTFKAADAHLRFVFLTGVTKFSQISVFSGFNQPKDISMDSRYDAICGITTQELYSNFGDSIARMAEKLGYTIADMKDTLKNHYDGYHFSGELLDVYNPFSIINAFDSLMIDNYWYRSGTPSYLAKLLEGHHVNMQELTSRAYTSDYFIDYRAGTEATRRLLKSKTAGAGQML